MTDGDSHSRQRVAKGFEKVLNSHGHGFQYSVLTEASRLLYEIRSSQWVAQVPEFPVEVQGYGTRIDFILKHAGLPVYLVAECKRVNPALANWCFVKTAFTPAIDQAQHVTIEGIRVDASGQPSTSIQHLVHSNEIFHLAVEVKSDDKGDVSGQGRGTIEEAAAQVCRGLSGLINFLGSRPGNFEGDRVLLLPVIFTTAKIWTSNIDLGSASLEDGKITLRESEIQEKAWIFYQYHQSPGLKHSVLAREQSTSLDKVLYNEYVRNIAVVSSNGIADFLERSSRWL
jgi:hypothetical protein